jgi:D-alanyl-D-alanine carboxypeptidase
MFRARIRASRALRWGVLALSALFVATTISSDSADARGRRHPRHGIAKQAKQTKQTRQRNTYTPPYAAIVVDANSGRVLHAANPDSVRHPASITKIMTLYLLFEQIEAGKLQLDTPLAVSAHAASQAPSKLDLKPGQTIAVEDAIKALVTKSANDVAVVIAEAIGGDEDSFAEMMTRKARALGMSRTVYANASGLPNDDQVTTARDQALLGRAIQDRFPRQYRYFSTSSFYYRGHAIRNHNRLLGRVAGVDGIKTGYIHASGFNLVTSVRRGNRHLVAVVIGGSSAGSRDARMRSLIEDYIGEGATERTAAKIVESPALAQAKPIMPAPRAEPKEAKQQEGTTVPPSARAALLPPSHTGTRAVPGSSEPIAAVPVRTLTVRAAPSSQSAALAALSLAASQGSPIVPATTPQAAAPAPTASPAATAPPAPVTQPAAVAQPAAGAQPAAVAQAAAAQPAPAATTYQMASAGSVPAPGFSRQTLAQPAEPMTAPATTQAATQSLPQVATQGAAVSAVKTPPLRSGWMIQIGAFQDETEAREKLQSAQTIGKKILARADGFTERVVKGGETLYRARFAVLDEDSAEAACRYFKRNKIACFAVKN